jgi:hypothetical protein
MAVLDRLLHRRPELTAPAIDKTAEASPPSGLPIPSLDDVSGYAQLAAGAAQDEAGPAHWEPECGTPVHSKRHLAR